MRFIAFRGILGLSVLLLFQSIATADHHSTLSIAVKDAWIRPTPPGQTITAIYLVIHNGGTKADRLIGASSPIADVIEIHRSAMIDGMMEMRPVPGGISVPPNSMARLKPGGLHLMVIGVKTPIKPGDRVEVRLIFQKAGDVKIQAIARMHGGDGGGHGSHRSGGMKLKMRKGKKKRK